MLERRHLAVTAMVRQTFGADGKLSYPFSYSSYFGNDIFQRIMLLMTDDLKQRIQEELRQLESELRTEIPAELKKAVALGDLSENAEYESARNRQDYVRARIANLRKRLADLSMMDLSRLPKDRIAYGSTVELYDVDSGEDVIYKLVMAEDANIAQNTISTSSPIGKGLMGHREGEEVVIVTPSGKRRFEIVKLVTVHDQA